MEPAELARRQPLWDAMSELFLDTERRWAVPFVAQRCASSGLSDAALDRVFWVEVFPEAVENLLQVAGDWAMLTLDESALVARAATGRMPARERLRHGGLVADLWAAVLEVTGWLRELPDAERSRHVRVLELLGHLFFDRPVRAADPFADDRALARELWLRYEPVCRTLARSDEPPDAWAAVVDAALGP